MNGGVCEGDHCQCQKGYTGNYCGQREYVYENIYLGVIFIYLFFYHLPIINGQSLNYKVVYNVFVCCSIKIGNLFNGYMI